MYKVSEYSTRLKHAYWRVRELLELSAIDDAEAHYRLKRNLNLGYLQKKTIRLYWGNFQYVSLDNVCGQFEEIFLRRQYAFATDKKEPVIIDCGGNVGLSAIWFKLNYPKCRLTVYEADPDLAKIICINFKNANMGEVDLRNEVVWTKSGAIGFQKTGNDSGRIEKSSLTTYPCIDLVEQLPDCVDLLKMDIEGAEYSVLNRLCQTGAIEKVKCLVCEFHVWQDKIDDFLETLRLLRASKMQLAMNSAAGPHLGLATEESPFEIIKRKQVLVELFAWRPAEPSHL